MTRRAAMRSSTAISSTNTIRATTCAGPAKKTLVRFAALVLCETPQTNLQAMPGSFPQALASVSGGGWAGRLRAAAARAT